MTYETKSSKGYDGWQACILSEIWDTDTEGLDVKDPHLKTDEQGQEFYVYEP